MKRAALVAAIALLSAAGTPARAQGDDLAPARDESGARDRYERGRTLYERGDFSEAIRQFEQAHDLSGAPGLLYDIAQAHRKSGDCANAARYYKRYLADAPLGVDRSHAEDWAQRMESCVERERRKRRRAAKVQMLEPAVDLEPAPPIPPAPITAVRAPDSDRDHPAANGRGKIWGGVGALASGAAFLGLSARAGSKARDADEALLDHLRRTDWDPEADRLARERDRHDTRALVFATVGTAAAATGAILLYLGVRERRQASTTPAVSVTADGQTYGFALSGSF